MKTVWCGEDSVHPPLPQRWLFSCPMKGNDHNHDQLEYLTTTYRFLTHPLTVHVV